MRTDGLLIPFDLVKLIIIVSDGPIGLQHHGGINKETGKLRGASSLVQFRNIWIKEL